MFDEDCSQNIYTSWRMTAGIKKTKAAFAFYYSLRELGDFSKEEIHHLIWLLHEQLKTMPKGF